MKDTTRGVTSSFCAADKPQCVEVSKAGDGEGVIVTSINHAQVGSVYFDWDEWDAFVKGVKHGEFDTEVLRSAKHTVHG